MTENQWKKHRASAVIVGDLGWCSVVDGLVKIEGHGPFPVSRANDYKYTLPQRHWIEYERFLLQNNIPP